MSQKRPRDLLELDAEEVRRARVLREMTRQDLATAVGCCWDTVRKIEMGKPVSLPTAKGIARDLGVALKDLCGGDIGSALVTGVSASAA